MEDWGTAECVSLDRFQLVRRAADPEPKNVFTPNVWHVVVMAADAEAGTMQLFLNGTQVLHSEGVGSDELLLRPKLSLFGGGLAAQNRGGDCRRMTLYNQVLSISQIGKLQLQADQHLLAEAAPKYTPPAEGDDDDEVEDDDYYSDY
eukprot:TRINITY_DN54804_c0_g2_i2.p1 TRINITY_DN54804_c0_g2~~TRINITY_DN54804_c0_g2_i2.p1  ORF type:complete len:147 (+),score=41.54 TRINITY_DN54804_c0_g2_i2:197-637(+)